MTWLKRLFSDKDYEMTCVNGHLFVVPFLWKPSNRTCPRCGDVACRYRRVRRAS